MRALAATCALLTTFLFGVEAALGQDVEIAGLAIELRPGATLPIPCLTECTNPPPEAFSEFLVEAVLTDVVSAYAGYSVYVVPEGVEPENASGFQAGLRFHTDNEGPLGAWALGGVLVHRRTGHWTSPTTLERMEVTSSLAAGVELGIGLEVRVGSIGPLRWALDPGFRYHAYTPRFDLTSVFGRGAERWPSETRFFVADIGLRMEWSRGT